MTSYHFVPKGSGRNYDYAQDNCFVKLGSEATQGELCVVEDVLKPGFTLPKHHHRKMTEVFYVLEGVVEFELEDGSLSLCQGDTLTIPPNVAHAAYCENGGRMLTIFKNGRFDVYLERLNQLSEEDFNDPELMKQLAEEFDIFED